MKYEENYLTLRKNVSVIVLTLLARSLSFRSCINFVINDSFRFTELFLLLWFRPMR